MCPASLKVRHGGLASRKWYWPAMSFALTRSQAASSTMSWSGSCVLTKSMQSTLCPACCSNAGMPSALAAGPLNINSMCTVPGRAGGETGRGVVETAGGVVAGSAAGTVAGAGTRASTTCGAESAVMLHCLCCRLCLACGRRRPRLCCSAAVFA